MFGIPEEIPEGVPASDCSCSSGSTSLEMCLDDDTHHDHSSTPQSKRQKSRPQVGFQEEHEIILIPQHASSTILWYNREELRAIHREIYHGLSEEQQQRAISNKEAVSSTFRARVDDFSSRGLEEIRKRKLHKRQIRRQEYIQNVISLQRDEKLAVLATELSRSSTLRALHYAANDADEACLVYQETFARKRAIPDNRDGPVSSASAGSSSADYGQISESG